MSDNTPSVQLQSETAPPAVGPAPSCNFLWGTRQDKFWLLLAVLLIAVIGYVYGRLVETEILGFTHDDAVYAIAGKALIEGKGFTLLHVVGHPAQVKYPIFYPLILAWVWLVNPQFPQNLPLMTYVTLGFGLAGFAVLYVFLRQIQRFPGWLAILVMVATAANFYFMYFFSMLMSEAPYFFFSMLTLWVFCRRAEPEKDLSPRSVLWVLLLSVVTFHTRVLGICLMAAIGTWLLMNRQWKNAWVYGVGSFLLALLPWVWWTKTHTPPLTKLSYPLVNSYSNYGLEFIHNSGTGKYLASLGPFFVNYIHTLLEMMFPLLPNFYKIYPAIAKIPAVDLAVGYGILFGTFALFGYFLLQMVRTISLSSREQRFNPGAFSVPALYVVYYSLAIIFWNYADQFSRFFCVIMPLLWMYFFKPVLPLLDLGRNVRLGKIKAAAAVLFCLFMVLLAVWPVSSSYRAVYLSRSQHWVDSGKNPWLWGEYKTAFQQINKTLPQDAVLGVASDAVFYLYTNRPTFYLFNASLLRHRQGQKAMAVSWLMKSLDHYGVQYLVTEPHMQMRVVIAPVNQVAQALLDQFPRRFQKIYTSPRGAISIYKILPAR